MYVCVCVCVLRGLRRISKYGYSTPHKTESNHLAVDTMHVSVSERIGMYGGSRGSEMVASRICNFDSRDFTNSPKLARSFVNLGLLKGGTWRDDTATCPDLHPVGISLPISMKHPVAFSHDKGSPRSPRSRQNKRASLFTHPCKAAQGFDPRHITYMTTGNLIAMLNFQYVWSTIFESQSQAFSSRSY